MGVVAAPVGQLGMLRSPAGGVSPGSLGFMAVRKPRGGVAPVGHDHPQQAEEEFLRREALSTPPVCFGEKRIQDKGEDRRKKGDK